MAQSRWNTLHTLPLTAQQITTFYSLFSGFTLLVCNSSLISDVHGGQMGVLVVQVSNTYQLRSGFLLFSKTIFLLALMISRFFVFHTDKRRTKTWQL